MGLQFSAMACLVTMTQMSGGKGFPLIYPAILPATVPAFLFGTGRGWAPLAPWITEREYLLAYLAVVTLVYVATVTNCISGMLTYCRNCYLFNIPVEYYAKEE